MPMPITYLKLLIGFHVPIPNVDTSQASYGMCGAGNTTSTSNLDVSLLPAILGQNIKTKKLHVD